MQNIACYFEIPVVDMGRAMKFYSAVFQCSFTKDTIHGCEMAYFPFDESKKGITGALAKGEVYVPSQTGTLIYLRVESIDSTLERAVGQGAEILFAKSAAGSFGHAAEFRDCEGNRIGIFEPNQKV
jgi:predicted enzyme related to lactoylglutathione lyase